MSTVDDVKIRALDPSLSLGAYYIGKNHSAFVKVCQKVHAMFVDRIISLSPYNQGEWTDPLETGSRDRFEYSGNVICDIDQGDFGGIKIGPNPNQLEAEMGIDERVRSLIIDARKLFDALGEILYADPPKEIVMTKDQQVRAARLSDPDLNLNVVFSDGFDNADFLKLGREAAKFFMKSGVRPDREGEWSSDAVLFVHGHDPAASTTNIMLHNSIDMHFAIHFSPQQRLIGIFPHFGRLASDDEKEAEERDEKMRLCVKKIRALFPEHQGIEHIPVRKRDYTF